MGLVAAETIRSLSSSLIIPLNAATYALQLNTEFAKFELKYRSVFKNLNISLGDLSKSLADFSQTAQKFQSRVDNVDKTAYHLIRKLNDQLRSYAYKLIWTRI